MHFLPREVGSDQNSLDLLVTMAANARLWWRIAYNRIARRQDRVRVGINNVKNTAETRLGY